VLTLGDFTLLRLFKIIPPIVGSDIFCIQNSKSKIIINFFPFFPVIWPIKTGKKSGKTGNGDDLAGACNISHG
jgi:hypothetical protein